MEKEKLEEIEPMHRAEYVKYIKIYILLEMRKYCITETRKVYYKQRQKKEGSLINKRDDSK